MKNIVTSFLLGLVAVSFVSCDDNDLKYSGPSQVMFPEGTSGTYYIAEANTQLYTVRVGVSAATSADRTIAIAVDPASTAVSGVDYTMPASVVIKAGEYVADLIVTGIYAGVADGVKNTLILSINDPAVAQFNATYTVFLSKFCPFVAADFVGTWTATYYEKDNSTVAYSQDVQINWSAELGDTLELIDFHSDAVDGYFGPSTIKLVADYSDPANFNVLILDQFVTDYGGAYGEVWIKPASGLSSPFSSCDKTITLKYDPYFKTTTYWFGAHIFRAELVKK